jgi:hypothetical protein
MYRLNARSGGEFFELFWSPATDADGIAVFLKSFGQRLADDGGTDDADVHERPLSEHIA